MRLGLKPLDKQRRCFTGTFVRYGTKSGWKGRVMETILLKDIKDEHGTVVTDHLWFNHTHEFQKIELVEDDVVEFRARVKEYFKGYRGYREDVDNKPIERDYKLSHPSKVKLITTKRMIRKIDPDPPIASQQKKSHTALQLTFDEYK